LAILPQVNLVSNIGFGPEATHTFSSSPYSNIATESMDFPLAHPDIFLPCIKADAVTADAVFSDPSLIRRVIRKVKSLVG
jgi:hypothetical protein